jgi:hypothetical protein
LDITDVVPAKNHVQGLHCTECGTSLDLAYTDFSETVSGVVITITGLPVLRCPHDAREYLPDRSRRCIVEIFERATQRGAPAVSVARHKLDEKYNLTDVPFLYDADDYRYLPGLERRFDPGFLTPVFFNRAVLLKYDNAPGYRVKFASTTYGEIVPDNGPSISFGLNRNGKVVMWLGDIAQMPEAEQYYLRSENVESDHSIGSEFYDGQIDCIFTEPAGERRLFALRSQFIEAAFKRFRQKISHLDDETFALAVAFNAPLVDTPKERRHVADTLNKIHVESLDSATLGSIIKNIGRDPKDLGSLKRLQMALEPLANGSNVPALLSPFFVLYDFRIAASHLTSADRATAIMATITGRLNIEPGAGLLEIYNRLSASLADSYESLIKVVSGPHEPNLTCQIGPEPPRT